LSEDDIVELPVDGELDLHAFAPREVPSVVEEYLAECRRRGILSARLVHGRGKGVQRAVVWRLLGSLEGVVSWRQAPPHAGGWGATLVELAPPGKPGRGEE
jgi:DNA-nicking Smr family endonuclease